MTIFDEAVADSYNKSFSFRSLASKIVMILMILLALGITLYILLYQDFSPTTQDDITSLINEAKEIQLDPSRVFFKTVYWLQKMVRLHMSWKTTK